jgi:hypothetical protein
LAKLELVPRNEAEKENKSKRKKKSDIIIRKDFIGKNTNCKKYFHSSS